MEKVEEMIKLLNINIKNGIKAYNDGRYNQVHVLSYLRFDAIMLVGLLKIQIETLKLEQK